MSVPAVQSTTGSGSTTPTQNTSAADAASLDYNTFLKLLLAQLKNQDPTKPMDSTEYMSQLASFSNVEQSIKTNSKLDSLLTTQALSQAESLIGRTLTSADGTTTGEVVSVTVTSDSSVATLKNGQTITMGAGVTVS